MKLTQAISSESSKLQWGKEYKEPATIVTVFRSYDKYMRPSQKRTGTTTTIIVFYLKKKERGRQKYSTVVANRQIVEK